MTTKLGEVDLKIVGTAEAFRKGAVEAAKMLGKRAARTEVGAAGAGAFAGSRKLGLSGGAAIGIGAGAIAATAALAIVGKVVGAIASLINGLDEMADSVANFNGAVAGQKALDTVFEMRKSIMKGSMIGPQIASAMQSRREARSRALPLEVMFDWLKATLTNSVFKIIAGIAKHTDSIAETLKTFAPAMLRFIGDAVQTVAYWVNDVLELLGFGAQQSIYDVANEVKVGLFNAARDVARIKTEVEQMRAQQTVGDMNREMLSPLVGITGGRLNLATVGM